jgi:peptide/nickel transport system permease protein
MKLMKTYKQYWAGHKMLMISMHVILVSLLFTGILIGDKPILCKYNGVWHALFLNDKPADGSQFLLDLSSKAQYDYHQLKYDFVIWPMITMDPKRMESNSAWLAPFSKNQAGGFFILGSYDLGRDVFAGCIYGLHKSIKLSLLTIFISGILGIFIGSVFVYQSSRMNRISLWSFLLICLSVLLVLYMIILLIEWKGIPFQSFVMLWLLLSIALFAGFLLINKNPMIDCRLDFISLRYIEIMKSIPLILILLILLQIFKNPGVIGLACLISVVYTPVIAKYTRAFTSSTCNESYIDSLIAIGQSNWKIYIKHILPKVLSDLIPILAFGIANIILLEATLSFLGLGMPLDEVSLGTMMYSARSFPAAWWVVVFPGLLVFWLVATLNAFGELWSGRKRIRDYEA